MGGTIDGPGPNGNDLDVTIVRMDLPTFLRLYQIRAAQVMWFLGAGTSRSAGIKTAADMIWDFKLKLYCSQKKLSLTAITDLGDPIVQRKLQSHFDALGGFPPSGAEDEYAAYFEATYPSAVDRRQYLERMVADAKPSFGHRALALLMQRGLCRAAWTTNFDKCPEDAAAKLFDSTGKLLVADLAEPTKARRAWSESRWPFLGKLHGDYSSERLKNTKSELHEQDKEMRKCFVDACRQGGLAVVGYSGRDDSIMQALEEALDDGRGFPRGLFWFVRSEDRPYPRVVELIRTAVSLGIEAQFAESESFDELFSDIVRFLPETSDQLACLEQKDRPRRDKAPLRSPVSGTPVVRTCALPIASWPTSCRLVDCDIGGWQEIRSAIQKAGVDIEAQRSRAGVLAFGPDSEVRRAFEPHHIKSFESYAISPRRLETETGEKCLLRDALCRALQRVPGITVLRRGHRNFLLADPSTVPASTFNGSWAGAVDAISGTISSTSISWNEACAIRLDFRLGTLWLLLEPRVLRDIKDGTSEEEIAKSTEFIRERAARRHNRVANSILDGWIALIIGKQSASASARRARVRAFGISDGVDAEFDIGGISGYSGRSRQ